MIISLSAVGIAVAWIACPRRIRRNLVVYLVVVAWLLALLIYRIAA